MPYLFTSESVSEGHPDKVADQISDALIDHFMAFDPNSKVACETLVTTGLVTLAGEVKSDAYLDVQEIARQTIARIGYTKSEYQFDARSCAVISAIHEQSEDTNRGVDRADPMEQGAGDRRGEVRLRLVGLDGVDHLPLLDLLAIAEHPFGQGYFLGAHAQLGNADFGCHRVSPFLPRP